MLAELKSLTGDFAERSLVRGREMRELLESHPQEFCAAAMTLLASDIGERTRRYLIALLWTHNLLISSLADPSIPIESAAEITSLAKKVNPQLPAKLVGFVLEGTASESPNRLDRLLSLLRGLPEAATFRPLLTPLLRHPDARIRSKVALLAGEGNRNRTWFERRMQEEDPRVRANAIESAGGNAATELRSVIQAAISDPNNRVVGNAYVALYRLGDVEAIASLRDMLSHPDPAFRATAAWAMGETGDNRFLPLLARVLSDPNQTIKATTFRAMKKLRGMQPESPAKLSVRLLGEPNPRQGTLELAIAVVEGVNPVRTLPATAFQIQLNGEFAYRYSVSEEDCQRSIASAFLVPQVGAIDPGRADQYRVWLEESLSQRRETDTWILLQAALPNSTVRPVTLFGIAMDEQSGPQAIRPANAGELRKSLDRPARAGPLECFIKACESLRRCRGSAHLFILDPSVLAIHDQARLIAIARGNHVSVHALDSGNSAAARELCHQTGGFYMPASMPGAQLSSLCRGVAHYYQIRIADPDLPVRILMAAVRTAQASGEALPVEWKNSEIPGPP